MILYSVSEPLKVRVSVSSLIDVNMLAVYCPSRFQYFGFFSGLC